MPIYEYECPKCGEFEITQRITEDPLKKCPTCKSKVRKLISNTSFQLKGSGWYVTDYGGKKGAAKEGAARESAGKETSASSSDGESKTSASDKPADTTSKDTAAKGTAKASGAKAA